MTRFGLRTGGLLAVGCVLAACASPPRSDTLKQPLQQDSGSPSTGEDATSPGSLGQPDATSSAPDAMNCSATSQDQAGCPCTTVGQTIACYTGDPSTRGVGTCHDGTQACQGSGEFTAFGTCEGETLPSGPGACVSEDAGPPDVGPVDSAVPDTAVADTAPMQVPVVGACIGMAGQDSQSPWQIHAGPGPACNPGGMVFTQHGAPGEYAYATIPPENDPGWMVAQGQNIDFSQTSNLTNTFCQEADYSGGGACLDATDFNFFQTTFTIPANGLVTSLILTMADVDDGVQVKIFNSAYPNGVVDPGAYVTLGGSGTSNLAQYIVPGVNRIVLTHVDDCVVNSALEGVTITLNGNPVNGC